MKSKSRDIRAIKTITWLNLLICTDEQNKRGAEPQVPAASVIWLSACAHDAQVRLQEPSPPTRVNLMILIKDIKALGVKEGMDRAKLSGGPDSPWVRNL